MNVGTATLIRTNFDRLWETDSKNWVLNHPLFPGNKENILNRMMNFGDWLEKTRNIEAVDQYTSDHYKMFLDRYKNKDAFIAMKAEHDLQMLQLVLFLYYDRQGEERNHFVPGINKFREVRCPYCNRRAKLYSDNQVYGKRYGSNLYMCQSCKAQIRTFGYSVVPKGTLAKKRLRDLRVATHYAVCKYKDAEDKSYSEVMSLLQRNIGIKKDHAYIATMNYKECSKAMSLLR